MAPQMVTRRARSATAAVSLPNRVIRDLLVLRRAIGRSQNPAINAIRVGAQSSGLDASGAGLMRWLGRFCLECPCATLEDVEQAAKALRSAWWQPQESTRPTTASTRRPPGVRPWRSISSVRRWGVTGR
jgi:hypothetical protein